MLNNFAPNITNFIGMTLEIVLFIIQITLAIPRILASDHRVIPTLMYRLRMQFTANDLQKITNINPDHVLSDLNREFSLSSCG